MPAPTNYTAARWRRPDGSVIVRLRTGRLIGKRGPAGAYRVLRTRTTHAEAEAYVFRQGGYRRLHECFARSEGGSIRNARVKVLCRPPVYRPPLDKRPSMTPEQQAEVDARVEAHRQRVAAEEARLDEGVRRARSRPVEEANGQVQPAAAGGAPPAANAPAA